MEETAPSTGEDSLKVCCVMLSVGLAYMRKLPKVENEPLERSSGTIFRVHTRLGQFTFTARVRKKKTFIKQQVKTQKDNVSAAGRLALD